MNNTLPKISLHPLPGVGHEVGFNTQLLVESTRYGMSVMGMAQGREVTISLGSRWPANILNRVLCFSPCSALDKALCVQVEADVAMVVQDNWEARQNNVCKTVDINIRLR